MMMVLAYMFATLALAQTFAPGTTEVVVVAGTTFPTGRNVSFTQGVGKEWYALETLDGAAPAPAGKLVWRDPVLHTSALKVLQATGDLVNDGIFPSVTFNLGIPSRIVVTGKVDDPFPIFAAHLKIFTQEAALWANAPTDEIVTPVSALEHSVPSLVHDNLSWTAKNDPVVSDVKFKVKDGVDWFISTLRVVSGPGDTEDHSQLALNYSGRRYIVYHRDMPGATDPDIWLQIATWIGGTWTVVQDFGLNGSAGLDFPSIYVRNSGLTSEIAVVARSTPPPPNVKNVALWRCGPAIETSCETAAQFGAVPQVVTNSKNYTIAEVLIVPRAETRDVYVFVQDEGGANTRVVLLPVCGATGGSFTTNRGGVIPYPTATPAYLPSDQQFLGEDTFARSSVAYDRSLVHLALFQERQGATGRNLLHYSVRPADVCP